MVSNNIFFSKKKEVVEEKRQNQISISISSIPPTSLSFPFNLSITYYFPPFLKRAYLHQPQVEDKIFRAYYYTETSALNPSIVTLVTTAVN